MKQEILAGLDGFQVFYRISTNKQQRDYNATSFMIIVPFKILEIFEIDHVGFQAFDWVIIHDSFTWISLVFFIASAG